MRLRHVKAISQCQIHLLILRIALYYITKRKVEKDTTNPYMRRLFYFYASGPTILSPSKYAEESENAYLAAKHSQRTRKQP